MRKIKCSCCYRETPLWVVFGSIQICDHCRLGVIRTMGAWGFGLSREHPFLDEFAYVGDSVIKL